MYGNGFLGVGVGGRGVVMVYSFHSGCIPPCGRKNDEFGNPKKRAMYYLLSKENMN
jgi:hypothetical protein